MSNTTYNVDRGEETKNCSVKMRGHNQRQIDHNIDDVRRSAIYHKSVYVLLLLLSLL